MNTKKKYPRTFHLPNSPGNTSDDKKIDSVESILNKKVVITEKLDGSNVCLERDVCYARSHSGPPTHESFDQFKAIHASIKHLIPENFQIYGEYCFALHSIYYGKLPNYLNIFAVKDEAKNIWLSWEDVKLWADELKLPTVPELLVNEFDNQKDILNTAEYLSKQKSLYGEIREGIVIRLYNSFDDVDFSKSVMKWVRENHVTSNTHWKNQKIIKNKLR